MGKVGNLSGLEAFETAGEIKSEERDVVGVGVRVGSTETDKGHISFKPDYATTAGENEVAVSVDVIAQAVIAPEIKDVTSTQKELTQINSNFLPKVRRTFGTKSDGLSLRLMSKVERSANRSYGIKSYRTTW